MYKKIELLKVPVLVVYAKDSPYIDKSRKFYRKLNASRQPNTANDMYVFETKNSNDAILDTPNEFASCLIMLMENIGEFV